MCRRGAYASDILLEICAVTQDERQDYQHNADNYTRVFRLIRRRFKSVICINHGGKYGRNYRHNNADYAETSHFIGTLGGKRSFLAEFKYQITAGYDEKNRICQSFKEHRENTRKRLFS